MRVISQTFWLILKMLNELAPICLNIIVLQYSGKNTIMSKNTEILVLIMFPSSFVTLVKLYKPSVNIYAHNKVK